MTANTTRHVPAPPAAPPFPDADLLHLVDRLSDEERERFIAIRAHLQDVVRPASIDYWNREAFAAELLPALAALGLGELRLGTASRLFTGLVHAEIARADVSLSALIGIHNELIVGMIAEFGSPEQRERWLGPLRRFESLGAFALTEPEHGSDIAGGLATTARRDGEEWVITGEKRWIGSATVADFALIWARDEADGEIKGFIVESERPGYRTQKIHNKMGLRIMQNADIVLDAVRIPAANALPGATSFARANALLRDSRAWVGWQGVGLQLAAFDVARAYALGRTQFGEPLAARQLIQAPLSEILGNACGSLALMVQIAELQDRGHLEMTQAAMAKATITRWARQSVAQGRAILGGNGIVSDYEMAKLFGDAEILFTYEGSYEINALLVGRGVTGISAFV